MDLGNVPDSRLSGRVAGEDILAVLQEGRAEPTVRGSRKAEFAYAFTYGLGDSTLHRRPEHDLRVLTVQLPPRSKPECERHDPVIEKGHADLDAMRHRVAVFDA